MYIGGREVSKYLKSFAGVSTQETSEKATLLAAGISEAMNCTAFGSQAHGRDGHNRTAGKAVCQNRLCFLVIDISKSRDQDQIVGDQVVCISRIGKITATSQDRIVAVDGKSTAEMSTDEAASMLASRYALSGALKALPGESDQNFLVSTPTGRLPSFDMIVRRR